MPPLPIAIHFRKRIALLPCLPLGFHETCAKHRHVGACSEMIERQRQSDAILCDLFD